MDFHNILIKWYLRNKRDLPWRKTVDPYQIWLSEIMLQQTRVAQGMPYFFSFTKEFPTVKHLADASEEKILKLWQGLGYYSRARNLHKTAQFISNDLNGVFPNSYKELLKLKGVGEYTAAAIASFSYNEVVPVVDGNVFRVLSRYFDIESDIALPATKKEFAALAQELMPKDNPAIFNQAIMEFGALQCVPKSPDCSICDFNESCAALQKGKVNILPIKSKKIKVTNRYFNYLILEDASGNTIIHKRTAKGIWHNLYEFPLLETESIVDFEIVSKKAKEEIFTNYTIIGIEDCQESTVVHKLSHQHLHIQFWKIKIKEKIENGIDTEKLKTFPFPIVIYNFIEKQEINC
ncbi:A/G-specific adenine glycosylase [Flavobacterium nitrogenifigens]|uniref:Adenine DNA glycosylase n=2 Tax=Flavobacterium TaxID=237 RepID=A0A7W7N6D7_9FLAO|nr:MULTISPECIES: A/G-specific adenine glycosylase [Flavobacterium]MBB4800326.1 A/G-specific adenine glycosylase [Flavobacterium nitrogenifigens]MBB6385924.1 A/G-specific adenine glycosylase [Flavobacterium notoginsengisoli]